MRWCEDRYNYEILLCSQYHDALRGFTINRHLMHAHCYTELACTWSNHSFLLSHRINWFAEFDPKSTLNLLTPFLPTAANYRVYIERIRYRLSHKLYNYIKGRTIWCVVLVLHISVSYTPFYTTDCWQLDAGARSVPYHNAACAHILLNRAECLPRAHN